MTSKKTSNIAASVRHRLLRIIRETGEDANLTWTRYATERLLYRLSVSEHADDFILKGAMLFIAWTGQMYRPTVDIDFLGFGEDSSRRLTEVFRAVCRTATEPDGLVFDPDSIKVEPIREEQQYQGRRITLVAYFGKARIPIQVDVGFGDVVIPEAELISYPTILDFPAPSIRAYPRETVVAEKLESMVVLGIANSRMKDFYDIYILARDFTFDGETLVKAIKGTFERRNTSIPLKVPFALTDEFGSDDTKSKQWKAFIQKNSLAEDVPELPELLLHLRRFLVPPLESASGVATAPKKWEAKGPWMFAKEAS